MLAIASVFSPILQMNRTQTYLCAVPCRARKARRVPLGSSDMVMGEEGKPHGVSGFTVLLQYVLDVFSRGYGSLRTRTYTGVKFSRLYSPLPPMTPMRTGAEVKIRCDSY